jgi:hypothetical protein
MGTDKRRLRMASKGERPKLARKLEAELRNAAEMVSGWAVEIREGK